VNSNVRPHTLNIRVLGAHLPRLDQAGIGRFIATQVASFKATLLGFLAEGRFNLDAEEIEQRALELPEELNADLQRCALFEVEVTDNTTEFDPAAFTNPNTTYAGWEPAFLTLDGEAILTEAYRAPATLAAFRVAFYIHEWDEPGSLSGPTGILELPPFTAVPERLWKLAPYSCVD